MLQNNVTLLPKHHSQKSRISGMVYWATNFFEKSQLKKLPSVVHHSVASIGIPITHTIIIGAAITSIHIKWSPEYQSISVSILTFWTLLSISMHCNMLKECFVIVGWSRKIIVITEMTIFLFKSFTFFKNFKAIQINEIMVIKIIGSNPDKNVLKMVLEFVKPLIS
jgi:hypothetical protein